jgi:hypothetical protein
MCVLQGLRETIMTAWVPDENDFNNFGIFLEDDIEVCVAVRMRWCSQWRLVVKL